MLIGKNLIFVIIWGNFESDESEPKQKYEGQKQINVQLQEQKKWLEHELEEVTCNLLMTRAKQTHEGAEALAPSPFRHFVDRRFSL